MYYAFYDNNGVYKGYTSNCTDCTPRPWINYTRDIKYINGVPTAQPWRWIHRIYDYDTNGFPKKSQINGWDYEYYEWESSGLLKKRTFGSHIKQYEYFPNTRLLKSSTEIDGQITNFEYDGLSRLWKTKTKNDNVTTEYSYHYTEPSNPFNFVKTKTSFPSLSGSALTNVESFEYLDGLGRSIQTVQKDNTPDHKDLVTTVQYDNRGRVIKQYNPFKSNLNTGAFVTTIPPLTKFTSIVYEDNPLSRTLSTTPPDWFATTNQYGANTAADAVKMANFSSNYAAGKLSKVTTTDPNGNKTITFTDKKGQKILDRRTNSIGGGTTDTYYFYDGEGRLVTVVPPGANLNTPDLLFQYTYDERDRLISKKVPGQAAMTMVYDTRDLMTHMQDGNMALVGNWLHTKYDSYGRPTSTGFVSGSTSYSYTNQLTNTLYDNANAGIRNKGKVYLQQVKNLNNNAWINTYFSYDSYGRVQTTNGSNHLYTSSNADLTNFTYDFADNPLTVARTHKKNSSSTTFVNNRQTYDHQGRLLNNYLRLNNGAEQLISNAAYDARGRMSQKNLHGTSVGGFLQNVDYAYNEQNWLTSINQLNCLSTTGTRGGDTPMESMSGYSATLSLEREAWREPSSDRNLWAKMEISGNLRTEDGEEIKVEQTYLLEGKLNEDTREIDFTLAQELPNDVKFDASIQIERTDEYKVEQMSQFYLDLEEEFLVQAKEKVELKDEYAILLANRLQEATERDFPISAAAATSGGGGVSGGSTAYSGDLFALTLNYQGANSGLSAPAQKNGNIASMVWQTACRNPQTYGFQYDHLDRLTKGTYAEIDKNTISFVNMNRYYVYLPSGGYDARGNIKKMYRRGSLNNTNSYSYIDLMTYTYVPNSNQLQGVVEATSSNYLNNGFKSKSGGTGNYTYDVNGNLKTDQHKEITDITYNHLNLPSLITFSNNRSIAYIYDAAGKKLRKTVSENGTVIDQKDYCDGIEYNGTGQTLEAIYHTEGRVKYQGDTIPWQYEYTLKDHLGNARVTFKADIFKNGTTQKANENDIIQENSYYPFGMAQVQPYAYATQGLENKYQYNGKELNGDFGLDWMDYGARFYDGGLGRFGTVDRFTEKYSTMSPYLYTLNNPIRFIDINGDSVDVFRPDGSHLYTYDDGKDIISGLYMQNSETRDENTTIYSNGISFAYNDEKQNRGDALKGNFGFVVADDNYINNFVNEGIEGMSGTLFNVMKEGEHGGSIDYLGKQKGTAVPGGVLTITNSAEVGNVAYDYQDFGNYLTGQSLRRLGYAPIWTGLFGHGNTILNGPSDHGSREKSGWLDSKADQSALWNGYHHFKKFKPANPGRGNTPFDGF